MATVTDADYVFAQIREHTTWKGSYTGKLKNLLSQLFNHAIRQKGLLPKGVRKRHRRSDLDG